MLLAQQLTTLFHAVCVSIISPSLIFSSLFFDIFINLVIANFPCALLSVMPTRCFFVCSFFTPDSEEHMHKKSHHVPQNLNAHTTTSLKLWLNKILLSQHSAQDEEEEGGGVGGGRRHLLMSQHCTGGCTADIRTSPRLVGTTGPAGSAQRLHICFSVLSPSLTVYFEDGIQNYNAVTHTHTIIL